MLDKTDFLWYNYLMVNERIQEAKDNLHRLRIEKGVEDATSRFGINIPYDMPVNTSAGYSGARMAKIRKDFKETL